MGARLVRGLMLFQQSRYELAEKEFREELAEDPQSAKSHALLAYCLTERGLHDDAMKEGNEAIQLAPDWDFSHFVLARVFYNRNQYPKAERAIVEAIRLDPENAEHHALYAAILADQGRWEEALQRAERGLAVNPADGGCTNVKAKALIRLNGRDEAGATALAGNPERALNHSDQGWTLLRQGDHRGAFEHFVTAIWLDPDLDWARQGIVEAMKARNLLYRPILRPILGFFLWTSRLSDRVHWALIIAAGIVPRILRAAWSANPTLMAYVPAVVAVIFLSVAVPWVADPLFNLVLCLDRFGRLALSREQVVALRWIGACMLGVLLGFLAFAITRNLTGLAFAVASGALIIGVTVVFSCTKGWRRLVMSLYTGVLAVVAVGGVVFTAVTSKAIGSGFNWPAITTFGIVIGGAVASKWLAQQLSRES
jgi:tetratricopeptide (TPR) repeat protein